MVRLSFRRFDKAQKLEFVDGATESRVQLWIHDFFGLGVIVLIVVTFAVGLVLVGRVIDDRHKALQNKEKNEKG